jgi:tellurite resistance protein TerC
MGHESSIGSPAFWAGFVVFVLAMLALDLGVFHRHAKATTVKDALSWSLVWIALSLAFNGLLWWRFGTNHAVEFLAGYLLEKSLSVDNIFVFVVLFGALGIPKEFQHRVLFWGVASALVLRAAMIFAGTAALERFDWLMYIFGGFLVITGAKLFADRNKHADPSQSWALRAAQRFIPTTPVLHGEHFFVVQNGKRLATPLFMALVLIEISDVIFAVDSIPAVFAITTDPFIVFTSNIFAILGLRSLFFLLADLVDRFRYLKVGLSGVLVFVGLKMTLIDVFHVPPLLSLLGILAMLGASVVASLIASKREDEEVRRSLIAP